jgi:hypothetical protein
VQYHLDFGIIMVQELAVAAVVDIGAVAVELEERLLEMVLLQIFAIVQAAVEVDLVM